MEGLPVTILEACASGLPVLTGPFGGGADFVRRHECGVVLDTLSEGTIRDALKDLSDNLDLITRFSKRALLTAQQTVWSKVIHRWIEVFGKVARI